MTASIRYRSRISIRIQVFTTNAQDSAKNADMTTEIKEATENAEHRTENEEGAANADTGRNSNYESTSERTSEEDRKRSRISEELGEAKSKLPQSSADERQYRFDTEVNQNNGNKFDSDENPKEIPNNEIQISKRDSGRHNPESSRNNGNDRKISQSKGGDGGGILLRDRRRTEVAGGSNQSEILNADELINTKDSKANRAKKGKVYLSGLCRLQKEKGCRNPADA